MKRLNIYISAIVLLWMLGACQKVVNIDVATGDPIPYVDAWITDRPGPQQIKFQTAVGYLDQSTPPPISNAQISVTDLTINKTYDFVYKEGAYTHDPGAGNKIGVIGHEYKLSINWNGELYEATDKLNRVPKVDSITVEYKEEKANQKEGYYAKFYAVDLPGGMDYYWIRTYVNGVRNQNVAEMVSVDGSYYENVSDGLNFIVPIREGITSNDKPYKKGDVVRVLIRSTSKPTYDFVRLLSDQLQNGGLFAKVLANVPANLVNKQAGSKNKIYGWFGTVGESDLSKTME